MAIPNIIPQVIALLFYITAIFFDAPVTMILENTLCAAVVMVVLFGVFAMGYIGGGGAKLIASLSIWLGFTNALGHFLAINAVILAMAVPVLVIVRALLKRDTPTGIPILPIALFVFLTVFPTSDLFRHISPRFEMMIAGFLPQDTASQPPLPETGVAPLRSTIVPGFKDVDAGKTRQTAGPVKYVVLLALIMLLLNQVARYFLRKDKTVRRAPGSARTRVRRKPLPKDSQPLIDPKRLEAIMNRPARPMAVVPERDTGTAPFPPVALQANGRLGPIREEADPFKAEVPPWEPDFFADFVDGMSRPAVIAYRPYPPPRIPVGRSKVGGDPDLPAGMEWPRTVNDARYVKAGMPLHFMAQIDLSELPWRPEECPERGTLLFFARLDEDMLWGEDFTGDPRNDTRVVYDPLSNGVRTPPPEDLGAINGSNNLFDEDFSPPDQPVMRSYPEWPLVFSGFSTMLAPSDLLMLKAPDGYREARDRYYVRQLDRIFPKVFTGRPPSRFFPVFHIIANDSPPFREKIRSLKPHDETGFPYSPLCVSLFCRYIAARQARWSEVPDDSDLRDFLSRLSRWKDWCNRQHGYDLDAGDARDFIDYLNRFLASEFKHKKLIVDAIQRTLNELINQSGGDPALAARLPESIYLAGKHQPLIQRESEDEPLPEKPDRTFGQPYHQLFGYLSSVQFNIPVNDPNMLLLQLFSDYGSNMMLCDAGEADFFIKPEDLKQGNWDKVVGQTCGG